MEPTVLQPSKPEDPSRNIRRILNDPARKTRLRGWRRIKDKASRHFVGAGGFSVILALGVIFLYLFSEVLPMFVPASVQLQAQYAAPGGADRLTLHIAMDRHREAGARFDADGSVTFFRPQDGSVLQTRRLPIPEGVSIASFAHAEPRTRLLAFGLSDGSAVMVKDVYRETFPNDVRLVTPDLDYVLGDEPIVVDDRGEAIATIAVQEGLGGIMAAAATASGRLLLVHYGSQRSFLTGETVVNRSAYEIDVARPEIERILIAADFRTLLLLSPQGDLSLIDIENRQQPAVVDTARVAPVGGRVSAIEYLLGTVSVIVGGSDGSVTQWFPVRDENNMWRIRRIRGFEPHSGAVTVIQPAYTRKGFATGGADGTVKIHFATSQRTVADFAVSDVPIRNLMKAPRSDGLLAADAAERVSYFDVHNEHPQISFHSLWQKVHYEGYSEPEYIWQSSSATDEFESKFSLVPLSLGTAKAALYAMLFAVPLALMGALYSGYFMTPKMRSFVKPTIEIMAALPTVILGFLAGLWFAPFVESHLPAIFSMVVVMPLGMIAFAFVWSALPRRLQAQVPEGWEAALLIPATLILGWFCISLSPVMEVRFFDGDMRQWLTNMGITYDQRNALVVGVAMGFAVIPTIFSIAEDAIFSVPRHLTHGSLALGATPWQTAVRIVIATASPGLLSAVMIGLGRAVGETMIVLMATGNSPVVNFNLFEGMRTLSANIAVELPETEVGGTHYRILFFAALVLFILTFIFNSVAEIVRQRLRRRYSSL